MATIAELLLAKGRMLADARRQSGERSAQLAQNLAGIASNAIGSYLQQKEEQPYRQAQLEELRSRTAERDTQLAEQRQQREDRSVMQSAMSSGLPQAEVEGQLTQLGRGDLVSQFKATKAKDDVLVQEVRARTMELRKLQTEYLQGMAKRLRPFVGGPGGMEAMQAAVQEAVEDGAFDQQEADQFWQQISANPQALPQLIDALDPQEAKAPRLMSVNPGDTVINQDTGQTVFTAPAAVKPQEPDTRSLQLQASDALKKGDTAEYARIMRVIRESAAAGRDPNARSTDPTPTAQLNATRQLRNDFVRETAAANTAMQQFEQMKSSLDAVKKGSLAAGSQGVLVTFQKILDPTSVVRESEYARSASGLSLLDRLEGQLQTIQQGGAGVPVAELDKFVQLSEQFARNQAKYAAQTKSQIDAVATKYGLDPSLITREIGPDVGGAQSPPPPAQSAGTIRARDPQGNIHEAKAGTPLPKGWVQVP